MPRTDSALPGVLIQDNDSSGLITSCQGSGAPSSLATAASKFAIGCEYTDTTSGLQYSNVGTVAVPSWDSTSQIDADEVALAEGNILVGNSSGLAVALDIGNTNAGIAVGNGTTATIVALSGDVTMDNAGAVTIGAGVVENSMLAATAVTADKTVDSAGVGGLFVKKTALVVYDFAVDGGAQGAIALTGSPTIPDNAVCFLESYDVLTTFTSGGADAGTVELGFPTDGALNTATAISDASNPWDAGVYAAAGGGLGIFNVGTAVVKTTAARTFTLTVAGGNDLTAGKAVFQVSYWVSA